MQYCSIEVEPIVSDVYFASLTVIAVVKQQLTALKIAKSNNARMAILMINVMMGRRCVIIVQSYGCEVIFGIVVKNKLGKKGN